MASEPKASAVYLCRTAWKIPQLLDGSTLLMGGSKWENIDMIHLRVGVLVFLGE
jgi:hypothetical protein